MFCLVLTSLGSMQCIWLFYRLSFQKAFDQINTFMLYRFLHIGPILTSFIYGHKTQSSAHADVNNTQMFDPLRILPISDNETTVILCSNALDPFYSETAVALNTIALRYGFQVSYCNGYNRLIFIKIKASF